MIIMIIVIIIMAVFISNSGGSEAKVELNGDQDEALIQQSSGVHLLEVNGADLGSIGCKGSWSWSEYICVLLVFYIHFEVLSHRPLLFSDKKFSQEKSDSQCKSSNGESDKRNIGQRCCYCSRNCLN